MGGARGRRDVFAQVGPTDLRPRHIEWAPFIEPAEFRERVRACSAMVAHAGMGSILTAMEFGKPILVMPRRGALMETRNDHQVATARRFLALGRIASRWMVRLPGLLEDLVAGSGVGVARAAIGRHASAQAARGGACVHPQAAGPGPAGHGAARPSRRSSPGAPEPVSARSGLEAQVKPPRDPGRAAGHHRRTMAGRA